MTVRTARLIGRAYSDDAPVSLEITWGGEKVYDGAVFTRPTSDRSLDIQTPRDNLCEWTFPIDLYGDVPIAIHVKQGELLWQAVHTNYSFLDCRFQLKLDMVWEKYVPANAEEVYRDDATMNDEEFDEKYGPNSRQNFEMKLITPPEDNFMGSLNLLAEPKLDNDGKLNVRIDGQPKQMDLSLRKQGLIGDWTWSVFEGQTIEADVTIEPPRFFPE